MGNVRDELGPIVLTVTATMPITMWRTILERADKAPYHSYLDELLNAIKAGIGAIERREEVAWKANGAQP